MQTTKIFLYHLAFTLALVLIFSCRQRPFADTYRLDSRMSWQLLTLYPDSKYRLTESGCTGWCFDSGQYVMTKNIINFIPLTGYNNLLTDSTLENGIWTPILMESGPNQCKIDQYKLKFLRNGRLKHLDNTNFGSKWYRPKFSSSHYKIEGQQK
jgi:hypothetical protein